MKEDKVFKNDGTHYTEAFSHTIKNCTLCIKEIYIFIENRRYDNDNITQLKLNSCRQ